MEAADLSISKEILRVQYTASTIELLKLQGDLALAAFIKDEYAIAEAS